MKGETTMAAGERQQEGNEMSQACRLVYDTLHRIVDGAIG